MNTIIDICIISVVRPSVLDITLKSFTEKMLTNKNDYRIIINVDPIGENIPRKHVLKVVNNYFDNVVFNYPSVPGFTKAVKWCWEQTNSKYVFHLEDDWKLLSDINIQNMIEILNKYDDLASLRLDKHRTGKSKHSCKYGFIYHPKISLNPTLFRGDFLRNVAELMDVNLNPEKQLRPSKSPRGQYISKFNNGIYVKDGNKVVLDIGRTWMNQSDYTKKTGFLNWQRKK